MFTRFDAATVRESERFSYWHEEMCRNFCRAESKPVTPRPFNASLSCADLGSVQISSIDCEALRYQRAAGDVRSSPAEDFLLSVLVGGSGRIEQQGRLTQQNVNDVVIYDTAQPFVYEFPDRYQMVLLKIPRRAMLARVPEAERLTALKIDGQTPLGSLAATMIRNAATLDLQDGAAAAKVGTSIIDVIAAVMDVQFAGSSRPSDRHASLLHRAQAYMRSHLDDPELGVDGIAAALHMSSSTLGRLFAGSGTTVMRWLWEERLAAGHRALLEGRARQVTEVALTCGFSSFSHFSRSFKARYGHSPNTLIRARTPSTH
jgi:AraC-like DNA-binding protein